MTAKIGIAWLALGTLGLAFVEIVPKVPNTSNKILMGAMILYLAYRFTSDLRGSRRPFDEVTDMFRQAEAIRKNDPAAAQRFVDNYFQEAERRREHEKATLRAQALTDGGAAKRLAIMLHEDLTSLRDVQVRVLPRTDPGKRVAAEASNMRRQREIEAELSRLEDKIRLAPR